MFGCLRKVGCLLLVAVVLVVAIAVAWYYRDAWMYRVHLAPPPAASSADSTAWQPVTAEGAARAKSAVEKLSRKSGPVFADVTPGELTAYVLDELSHQLPPSAQQVSAAVKDRHLWVRTVIPLRDLGGSAVLGPFAGMLSAREPVQFGGTLDVVHKGLAEYRITAVKVGDFSLPAPVIPKVLAALCGGSRPAGVAANALPLTIPPYIGDVRVARGKITLYKDVR
ncbi:MAG TPA: hypothetical protein VFW98_18660 [Gemmatimonadaceae bacterium]|nr:hypothetical protein [Gemmatimonadaceae bacterium]